MKEVVREEVFKWLNAGFIYAILDSPWVSPVHVVPKKGGFTVISNKKNKLIPIRTVTQWRVCIDYRKLNTTIKNDHYPLPLVDQMLDRLSGLLCHFFLKSVVIRIPSPTRMADPNRSSVYSDRFHLSYQNILFMSFHFRVFNYAEAVSNGRPINIYFYTIRLQNGVSCLYKMIYKTIVQRLTLLFTKCHMFKKNGMHMTGYILIRRNFLYDSTLLDLAFFPIYLKPAHR